MHIKSSPQNKFERKKIRVLAASTYKLAYPSSSYHYQKNYHTFLDKQQKWFGLNMQLISHVYLRCMGISELSATDEELIILLNQGDASAYQTLYGRYWQELFDAAFKKTDDADNASDIVQNVLVNLWERRGRLMVSGSLRTYLHGAVKKQVLHYFRSEKIKTSVMLKAAEHLEALSAMHELKSYLHLEQIVEEETEYMPENMKKIFILRHDNHSVKEIADILNLAEQTVSNNLTQAVKRLRKRLVSEFPDQYTGASIFVLFSLHNLLM